jgi:hypothetical protein
MDASSPSSFNWRAERRKRLLRAAGMLLVLSLATGGLFFTERAARQARLEMALAQGARQEALQSQAQAQSRAELEKLARDLSRLAEARGETPRHWARRFIDLRQTQLARGEANRFFGSILRAEGRLFHAEAFDLAVTGEDTGLFQPGKAPLLLTVHGTLLFRVGEGAP